jgi:hypothetical protein
MDSTRRDGRADQIIATRSDASSRRGSRRWALAILFVCAWPGAQPSAQSVTVSAAGDVLRVKAPGFGFIKGEPLARLKDGRSIRVDLGVAVLPGPGAAAIAQNRQVFVLSYDLWEERFAVTQAGVPPRAVSHLTAAGAEAWCLEQLTVAVAALGALGRDRPFWVRLEYRILDGDAASPENGDAGYTLRWLIDALSRRRKAGELSHAIEAGPLRLRP